MGNMFFKHLYRKILVFYQDFFGKRKHGIQCVFTLWRIFNVMRFKNSPNLHLSNCHLKEVLYIVCVHKLEQNFNLGHKWQFGKSMDYKICIMGNTTHPKHEGACFFQSWVVTIILVPWKIETLSTPKPIRLEAKLVFKSPPNCSTFTTITFVKLYVVPPVTICSNVNNIGIHFHPWTT